MCRTDSCQFLALGFYADVNPEPLPISVTYSQFSKFMTARILWEGMSRRFSSSCKAIPLTGHLLLFLCMTHSPLTTCAASSNVPGPFLLLFLCECSSFCLEICPPYHPFSVLARAGQFSPSLSIDRKHHMPTALTPCVISLLLTPLTYLQNSIELVPYL